MQRIAQPYNGLKAVYYTTPQHITLAHTASHNHVRTSFGIDKRY